MGFIERILQQRSEEARRAAQAKQEREIAGRRTHEENSANNLQLRYQAQRYFFEGRIPQIMYDFQRIEPERLVVIHWGFTEAEWKAMGGWDLRNFVEGERYKTGKTTTLAPSVHTTLTWGDDPRESIDLGCDHLGTLSILLQKLKYPQWRTNRDVIDKAFEHAYEHPDKHYASFDTPGGWAM